MRTSAHARLESCRTSAAARSGGITRAGPVSACADGSPNRQREVALFQAAIANADRLLQCTLYSIDFRAQLTLGKFFRVGIQ